MSDHRWYRSLYWRIGLGFLVCVAAVLAAQAAVFVWLAGRPGALALVRSPDSLATVVASGLAAELAEDPSFDVNAYLTDALGAGPPVVMVVFEDGRIVTNAAGPLPEPLVRASRRWLQARQDDEPPPGPGRARDLRNADEADRPGPPGPPMRPRRRVPIVVNGRTIGAVAVLPFPRGPLGGVAAVGPQLVAPSILLFVVGSAVMAFFVFRPVHRRLLALQDTAQALGSGRVEARAEVAGGDEVAALAAAFNQMAEDLESRVRELRESDRVRRQLLADVSHELSTPLTAIRGYLETLAMPEAVPDAATRDRYLRIVTDETQRLQAIIGDLLDVARLEGGAAGLQMQDVDVASLFARARERHEGAVAERGVAFDAIVYEGASAVRGDERRLEQVLQNLVANAVRHTPAGGRIHLAATREGELVRLRVRDTGPGIPESQLTRIFERFARVEEARDSSSGGSGLGLAIVAAIVEAHGGTVEASNAPDGGACFDVFLTAASRGHRASS